MQLARATVEPRTTLSVPDRGGCGRNSRHGPRRRRAWLWQLYSQCARRRRRTDRVGYLVGTGVGGIVVGQTTAPVT